METFPLLQIGLGKIAIVFKIYFEQNQKNLIFIDMQDYLHLL